MFNQHAKWLKVCNHIPWRRPIASLNYLLSSHVWRQDHNGFSHQDPGFIDHVVNKKAEVVRVYLPPDANCLLSVTDHCLRSRNYINVVVAGKQPAPAWLTMDEAIKHCTAGVGIWEWASNDKGGEPDVVMACCGDVPTLETLAAVDLIRQHMPELKVRVINVVNLMKLQPSSEHPHGLSDHDFDTLFTKDKPIVFAFHGYPWLIHRLTYRRTNHKNLHVRGYKEEGTTTTPFDMVVLNEMDRFHLVQDVIDRLPQLGSRAAYAKQAIRNALIEHRQYINERGEDHPFVLGWKWGEKGPVAVSAVPPKATTCERPGAVIDGTAPTAMNSFNLEHHQLTVAEVHRNLPPSALYEHAIRYEKDASIAENGALVAYSGVKTGRSPKDKRVVKHPDSEKNVWWGTVNIPCDAQTFAINRQRALDYLNTRERLYCFDGFAGWDPKYRIKVRVICSRPYHALFMHTMLIRPTKEELAKLRQAGLHHLQRRRVSRQPPHHRHGFDHEHRPQPRRPRTGHPRHRVRRRNEEGRLHRRQLLRARSAACSRCTAPPPPTSKPAARRCSSA